MEARYKQNCEQECKLNCKFANEDEDHDGEMPHCGSRTATSVECMPAGWPRPAPNTLEVLYGEIECIGTEGHGPALFMNLKRHYFANKTPIGKKTATFTRQPPTLSSLANDVGGQPLARCHTRKKAS